MFLRALLLLIPLPCLADEAFVFRRPCMGTVWTVKLYAQTEESANAAAEAAFTRVEQLNAVLSDYIKDSELSRLSASAGKGEAMTVAGDLLAVLTLSQQAAAESGGVFDITVGPCVQLWRTSRKARRLPSPVEIAAAQAATGWESLELDTKAGTALLKKPGMKLDVGGIAKGYAQDEAVKVLEKLGVTSALIDAGGGIRVSARPPGRESWNVQVARAREDDPAAILSVENAAVATSGDLFQSVEIEGRHYSHIIDKTTGLGMTERVQATAVAPTGAQADWIATTLCLMGPEKGLTWLKQKHPEVQARIVRLKDDGLESAETDGFRRLVIPAAGK